MAWTAVWEKGVAGRREGEGWDYKLCPETEIMWFFQGGGGGAEKDI